MKHIVVGTAGHIDHGKSALVRALTGMEPDRLKEEKTRGITIDLGFARYEQEDTRLAFVDVPGHERFVRNMLAGASGIDCVLLVVAADESVMPQTREHFDICRLLDIQGGLIALTKSDLVDPETLELVRLESRELVSGSFLDGAPMVAVSPRTGAGLNELRAAIAHVAKRARGRSDDGVARLPIDRAFSVKGFGTVVTGTQVSGRIRVDSDLELHPAGRRLKVRGLQVHGISQSLSHAGQRVAINLSGVEVGELRRGDTLADPGGLGSTQRFDGLLTLLPSARALKHGARVRMHQGTAEVMARVALGAATGPEGATERTFPSVLDPGAQAFARLHLERPAALTRGDRFVLRAYSPPVTIAGGTVLDPQPPRGGLRSAAGLGRFRRLEPQVAPTVAVEVMINEAAAHGLPRRALMSRAGITLAQVGGLVEALVAERKVVVVGDLLVSSDSVRLVKRDLLASIGAYHRTQPLETGLPREEARERFSRRASAAVFNYIGGVLVAERTLLATRHLALASHQISLLPDEQRVRDAVERCFRDSGLTPPDVRQLVDTTGASPDLIDRMLRLLLRQHHLEKADALAFHVEALRRLKAEVSSLKPEAGESVHINVATFKERFGVTRKFAIPLLEYLDRERVTRRVGNVRIVL